MIIYGNNVRFKIRHVYIYVINKVLNKLSFKTVTIIKISDTIGITEKMIHLQIILLHIIQN